MYKLYLKIATRYLLKHRLYSIINIFGLAIGIASFVLIMLYVNYERSYDKFEGSENVYRVYMDALEGNTFVASDAQTANLIGPTLKREFPEVLEQVRLYRFDKVTFKLNDKVLEETQGSLADASYFNIFNYPMLIGSRETALKTPNSLVLTETLAKKIFGDENPYQKTLSAFYRGDEVLLTVTGIMEDIPKNTHLKTSFLISFDTQFTQGPFKEGQELNWNACNYHTYISVDKNAAYTQLRNKITAADFEDDLDERYNIEPLETIHLYSNKPFEAEANGSISRIRFLTAIAFIVLLLSWLNYINLSTTKSLERAKEIGIRKVSGAYKSQIIVGSMAESLLLNLAAFAIAFGLVWSMVPLLELFSGHKQLFDTNTLVKLLPVFGILVAGIILAGLYPAFLLSSYSPATSLKGTVQTSANGFHIRKGLIVLQFLATIVLLVGTFMVGKQINFLQEQPIGANLNNVIAFQGELLKGESDSLVRTKYHSLEGELKKLPFVNSVALAQTYPGDGYDNLSSFIGITYPDGKQDNHSTFFNYSVQSEYFDLMKIKFLAGNSFIKNPNGRSRNIVINEASMRKFGIVKPQEAIGKTVKFFGADWTINGVIENYHHFGLKSHVQPIVVMHHNNTNNLLVKFDKTVASTASFANAIAQVEKKWMQVFPESTFGFTFLDKKYQLQYEADKQFGKAFNLFTLLALFIACLGLFGLTSYTIVQRKKEIGIRKVNGATIGQILSLLNRDFVKWIGLAFVIAVPISWYAMNNWLSNFAYKTTISWWIFALAGITALVIALLTVSWQSFRAATANPVEALKDE